jgi:ketosteroid isomerase-like protein
VSREDEERLRRGYAAFNEGGVDAILEWLEPQITVHDRESSPDRETYHGVLGIKELFESTMEAFERLTLEPQEFTQVGDRMVVVVLQRAQGRGSGAEVESTVVHVWTMRDGRPSALRIFRDRERALEAARRESTQSG